MTWIIILVGVGAFALGVAVGAVGAIALAWEAGRVATVMEEASRRGVPW